MPKITMEFNLPEDQEDFDDARNGAAYRRVIDELYNWIRSQSKYTDLQYVEWNDLREKISELMKDEDLL